MSVRYRLIAPSDLGAAEVAAWDAIVGADDGLASPYFRADFALEVGKLRPDARVLLMEESSGIVGFFPFERRPLGLGRPIGGPISDYHGAVVRRNVEWAAVDVIRAAGLGVWVFDHCPASQRPFEPHARARALSPTIDLSMGYAAYLAARKASGGDFIKRTESKARKAEREVGPIRFEARVADERVLEMLITWKRAQYNATSLVDAFAVSWTRDLLKSLMTMERREFAGMLSALWFGDHLVAAHLGIRSHNTIHWWFPAYTEEYSKYSPGIVMLLKLAEWSAANGYSTLDFGKGDTQYKQSLATGGVELMEGAVERPSLATSLRRFQSAAEERIPRSGWAKPLTLPFRAIRKLEYVRRYR